jgi:hypothetical protein
MTTARKILIICLLLAGILPANAHPGHGEHSHDGFSVIHYFTEPIHVLTIIIMLIVVLYMLKMYKSKTIIKSGNKNA